MDQMDLPQIRRVWIPPRMKDMLHFVAIVRISFDPEAGNQPDRQHIWFAEHVAIAATHCGDKGPHMSMSTGSPRLWGYGVMETSASTKLDAIGRPEIGQ
jgi:hypothetical protein